MTGSSRFAIRPGIIGLTALALIVCASVSNAQRKDLLRSNPKLLALFRPVVAKASPSVVEVRCEDQVVALGTIIDDQGHILTKASELRGKAECRLANGKDYPAKVLSTNKRFDLALLKIEARSLKPIQWRSSKEMQAGDWVATPGLGRDPLAIGVVSVPARKMPAVPIPGPVPGGYLGVYLSERDNGLRIAEVSRGSGAQKGGMKADDVIISVDGRRLKSRNDLLGMLSRKRAGQKVKVVIKRDEKEKSLDITLGKRPVDPLRSRGEFQNSMGSKLSKRRTAFPFILQHDTVVTPPQCGGPLVDLDGRAVGLNIARAGRTESYAIPSDALEAVIKELKEAGK